MTGKKKDTGCRSEGGSYVLVFSVIRIDNRIRSLIRKCNAAYLFSIGEWLQPIPRVSALYEM